MVETVERFWDKVNVGSETECWEWEGAITGHGYGNFSGFGRYWGAHRLSYIFEYGEVEEGLHIDHLCRNRSCVNPLHLEAVTQQENLLRGETIPSFNIKKTHCPEGHEYTLENTYNRRGTRECRSCLRKRSNTRYHKYKNKEGGRVNGV